MAEQDRRLPGGRVRLLDFLRGFSVVSMVVYHTMYDLVYMFGVDIGWYRGLPGYLWQQSICWVFILVSGATLHYGGRPVRRAFIVLTAAVVVSVVTAVAMPGLSIWFGILHMLGIAMLAGGLLRPLLQRIPAWVGLLVSAALFVFLRGVPMGYVGLLDLPLLYLPKGLYSTGFSFPLGLPGPGFASSDYFPLVPWLFLFFAGYFLWALVGRRFLPKGGGESTGAQEERVGTVNAVQVAQPEPGKAAMSAGGKQRVTPLEWVGQHSLIIYLVHQPIAYGLCLLLQAIGAL